jgi:hypothetical protein
MSYIICADVPLWTDMNHRGKPETVKARILSRTDSKICFDVQGEFCEEQARTLALCKSLIKAGFVEFDISHSF